MPERAVWTARTRIEAYSMIRRMLEDWPYQPPEVVEPEQAAFKRWVGENKPPMVDYVRAAAGLAGEEPRDA